MISKMRFAFLVTACSLFVSGLSIGCKRGADNETGMSDSDRRKLQELWERSQYTPTQMDLPEKYHARKLPDPDLDELLYVSVDDGPLQLVRINEFGCEKDERETHLKGQNLKDSCPLAPLLNRFLPGGFVWAEFAGKHRRGFAYDYVVGEDLEGGTILIAFVNKDRFLRVEARPTRTFLTPEQIAKGGKALRREGRAKKQMKTAKSAQAKRGAMRGKLRMREVYWIDLHSTPLPEEIQKKRQKLLAQKDDRTALAKKVAGQQNDEKRAEVLLSLLSPGGDTKKIRGVDLEACASAGCKLEGFLPGRFDGEWCVTSPGGVMRIPSAEMKEYLLKQRRQGGVVLSPGAGKKGTIRNPSLIAPCREGGAAHPPAGEQK